MLIKAVTLSRSAVHSSQVEDDDTKAVTSVGHRTDDGLGNGSQVLYEMEGSEEHCLSVLVYTTVISSAIGELLLFLIQKNTRV